MSDVLSLGIAGNHIYVDDTSFQTPFKINENLENWVRSGEQQCKNPVQTSSMDTKERKRATEKERC